MNFIDLYWKIHLFFCSFLVKKLKSEIMQTVNFIKCPVIHDLDLLPSQNNANVVPGVVTSRRSQLIKICINKRVF